MILLENKRVRFDYEILDTFEGGLVLEGWEVKSLRAKHANLRAAWVRIQDEEAFLENFQISPYRFSAEIQEKSRPKKLLLQKREIEKIIASLHEKGRTVAPTQIYTKGRHIKCEIIIGKGRKKYEKRQVLKERAMDKEAKRALKMNNE